MNVLSAFSPIARALIVMAAIAIVVTFLQSAASIIAPILLAVFIAVVATPPLRWMRRRGLPKWAALALIALVLFEAGSIFLLVTTGAMEGFRDSLPGYQERFMLLSDRVGTWLEAVGIAGSHEALPDIIDTAKVTALVRVVLSNVSDIFGIGLLILLAVVFMLLEAPNLPTKLKTAFHASEELEIRL